MNRQTPALRLVFILPMTVFLCSCSGFKSEQFDLTSAHVSTSQDENPNFEIPTTTTTLPNTTTTLPTTTTTTLPATTTTLPTHSFTSNPNLKNCNPDRYTWDCDPEFPFSANEGSWLGTGRGIGGITYQNWKFPSPPDSLYFHIRFHTDPTGPEASYIQLYESHIGGIHQYFGFQYYYEAGSLKTGFTWSRWGLKGCSQENEAEARSFVKLDPNPNQVVPGKKPEVAFGHDDGEGYCAPWVGIRYPYTWKKGNYTVRLSKTATIGAEDWYEVKVLDIGKNLWTIIGNISFPNNTGNVGISSAGGSWSEVWGGGHVTSVQIGYFHYSLYAVGTKKDTNTPLNPDSVEILYGLQAYGVDAVPNSDSSLDPNGRRVHVRYGQQTRRRTQPQVIPLK